MKEIKLKGKGLKKVQALPIDELAKIIGGKKKTGPGGDGIDTYSEDTSGGTTTDTYETSNNNDSKN